MRAVLLAGVQSGCGKTTATLALIQYLISEKQRVRGFKCGPDFLDPLWHRKLTGHSSYNLDTKMIGIDESRQKLAQAEKQKTDIAIIEGVMGLFDGRQGVGQDGSSAHLAQALDVDVWLVVDARGMSGSIVPLVSGFKHYAEKCSVRLCGIIASRVGSAHHAKLLQQQLIEHKLPPLIAWLDKSVPTLPERHLGLIKPDEHPLPDFSAHFHLEIDELVETIPHYSFQYQEQKEATEQLLLRKRVAIACDEACCFIYPANIDWLKQQGVEIQYFSPIAGEPIPVDCDALWLPGGYPELYAEQLEQSDSWESLRAFIDSDKPVLAECGGMMLLAKSLTDHQGKTWKMAGILPIETKMQNKLASLGYRECLSGVHGGIKHGGVRGHEFHHSTRIELSKIKPLFDVARGDRGIEQGNIKASYIHWYFPSAPDVVTQWFSLKSKTKDQE